MQHCKCLITVIYSQQVELLVPWHMPYRLYFMPVIVIYIFGPEMELSVHFHMQFLVWVKKKAFLESFI